MSRLVCTKAAERRTRDLVGDDTAQFGGTSGAGVLVKLAQNSFAPGYPLLLDDLVEASFGGYADLETVDKPNKVNDPPTQDALLLLLEPAGGWKFVATGTPPANTPQTIYGYYVTTHDGLTLLGSQLLPAPVDISTAGDFVDIGSIIVNFPVGFLGT